MRRTKPAHEPLTDKQYHILMWITNYVTTHGYAPALEEIGAAFELRSLATVHKHIVNLEMKGHLKRRWNCARSIELISARRCPYCGHVPETPTNLGVAKVLHETEAKTLDAGNGIAENEATRSSAQTLNRA